MAKLIFLCFSLGVTLHWNLSMLPINAQIDGQLPQSNVVESIYE